MAAMCYLLHLIKQILENLPRALFMMIQESPHLLSFSEPSGSDCILIMVLKKCEPKLERSVAKKYCQFSFYG